MLSGNTSQNITDCGRVISENVTEFSSMNISAESCETTLVNLSAYTVYLVKISAATSAGRGPENELEIRTPESSKSTVCFTFV